MKSNEIENKAGGVHGGSNTPQSKLTVYLSKKKSVGTVQGVSVKFSIKLHFSSNVF